MARARSRREFQFNAVLTVVLSLGIAYFANALAEDHLAWRRDLSEEELYTLDPATRSLLEDLDDVLQVRAFFTGKVKHGPVQIAKDRLIRQLGEFRALSGGRLRILYSDPNTSSEARLEASRYGIEPFPFQATQGTAEILQDVYLGVVLRYRGREAVIPFVLPQTFEYRLVSELNKLSRDELLTVGFLARDASLPIVDRASCAAFHQARSVLSAEHEVREVTGTADGAPVPEEIDILVVPQPVHLHPRAVWSIDQFVQRGGRLIVAVDHVLVNSATGRALAVETGLEALFEAWGIRVLPEHLWDQAKSNSLSLSNVPSGDASAKSVRLQYPYWIRVDADGLDPDVPALARLPGADFFWAHALEPGDSPGAARRTDLLFTSERSYRVPAVDSIRVDPTGLNALAAELAASGDGERFALASLWTGAFDSPFADAVPGARDAVEEALWLDDVRSAAREGEERPPYPVRYSSEPNEQGGIPTQVLVVGDADWMADGNTFGDRNQMLLQSLVEWVGLDEDYRAIRAKLPRDRSIADFLEEERQALGIVVLDGTLSWDRADEFSRSEGEAQRRAARRRWLHMGAATGGALLAVVALGVMMRLALGYGFRGTP